MSKFKRICSFCDILFTHFFQGLGSVPKVSHYERYHDHRQVLHFFSSLVKYSMYNVFLHYFIFIQRPAKTAQSSSLQVPCFFSMNTVNLFLSGLDEKVGQVLVCRYTKYFSFLIPIISAFLNSVSHTNSSITLMPVSYIQ